MKVEEKMKKNKNCELSHMVRPVGSLEVYKQKQNKLFISESVEHRMFKVTWARLWVWSSVCTNECTAECAFRAYAQTSARAYARPDGLDGRTVRWFVRLGYSFCTTRMGARLGWSWCTAWSGRVHGSVATHGLVAHGLNFMDMTEPCG